MILIDIVYVKIAKRIAKWTARVPVAKSDVVQHAEVFEDQLRVFLKTDPALENPDILAGVAARSPVSGTHRDALRRNRPHAG